ncbi:MAG: hypothetical protein LBT60_02030 [Oscillospiraceae bacterium]|jgi:tetrahydromethanopterin S-methyltransferase subunit G|nr:hypothetical protein [Oscillospiraceae bacterium]
MDTELLGAIERLLDQKLSAEFGPVNRRLDGLEAGQVSINARLDKVDARLDKVESRLDGLDARLDKVESRLDDVDSSLLWLRSSMTRIEVEQLPRISVALDAMDDNAHRLDGHDDRIDRVERGLDRQKLEIAALKRA